MGDLPKRGRPVGWRKPDARRKVLAVRLTDRLHERLDKEAEATGLPRTEIVHLALSKYFRIKP